MQPRRKADVGLVTSQHLVRSHILLVAAKKPNV